MGRLLIVFTMALGITFVDVKSAANGNRGGGSMARPPKGKPLTLRPIRLDDDVWAECQRLGKEHGTINEGLRSQLLKPQSGAGIVTMPVPQVQAEVTDARIEGDNLALTVRERPFKPPLLKPKEQKK